jgi:hypothetical protein
MHRNRHSLLAAPHLLARAAFSECHEAAVSDIEFARGRFVIAGTTVEALVDRLIPPDPATPGCAFGRIKNEDAPRVRPRDTASEFRIRHFNLGFAFFAAETPILAVSESPF